jgi:hypothetical protein
VYVFFQFQFVDEFLIFHPLAELVYPRILAIGPNAVEFAPCIGLSVLFTYNYLSLKKQMTDKEWE